MRTWLLLGLCLLPSVVMAKDTVWLDNGDRIVGDIVFKNDDHIVVSTAYAGRINIDWSRVATLETDKPITIVVKGVDGEAFSKLDVFENGMLICKQCKTPVVALKDIETLVYPTPWLGNLRSDGHLNLHADFDRKDNDSDDIDLEGELRVYHGRWRHIVNGEKERKSENDEVRKNKWNAKYDIDRFLGDHWYVRAEAEYERHHIEQPKRARSYSAGPGYLFWDNQMGRFDITLAYGRVRYDYDDGAQSYGFNATQLTWDFQRHVFGGRFDIYSKGTVAQPDISYVDFVAEAEFGVRYQVSSWLCANISYELDDIKTDYGNVRDYETKIGIGARW